MLYPRLEVPSPDRRQIVADKRGASVDKSLMYSPYVAPGFAVMADAVQCSKGWPATQRVCNFLNTFKVVVAADGLEPASGQTRSARMPT